MERVVDFKNFRIRRFKVSAEMFCDGKYVMELSCKTKTLQSEDESPVGLYKYFRHAALAYIRSLNGLLAVNTTTVH